MGETSVWNHESSEASSRRIPMKKNIPPGNPKRKRSLQPTKLLTVQRMHLRGHHSQTGERPQFKTLAADDEYHHHNKISGKTPYTISVRRICRVLPATNTHLHITQEESRKWWSSISNSWSVGFSASANPRFGDAHLRASKSYGV